MQHEKHAKADSGAQALPGSHARPSTHSQGSSAGVGVEAAEEYARGLTSLASALARRVPLRLGYVREDIVQDVLLDVFLRLRQGSVENLVGLGITAVCRRSSRYARSESRLQYHMKQMRMLAADRWSWDGKFNAAQEVAEPVDADVEIAVLHEMLWAERKHARSAALFVIDAILAGRCPVADAAMAGRRVEDVRRAADALAKRLRNRWLGRKSQPRVRGPST